MRGRRPRARKAARQRAESSPLSAGSFFGWCRGRPRRPTMGGTASMASANILEAGTLAAERMAAKGSQPQSTIRALRTKAAAIDQIRAGLLAPFLRRD